MRRDYPTLVRPHASRADRIVVPSHFTAGEVERHITTCLARCRAEAAADVSAAPGRTQTQTQTQTQTAAKGGPHKDAVDCTIPFQSFNGPQGTFTIQGTATAFVTPRSH